MSSPPQAERRALRQQMRQRRRSLTPQQQRQASIRIARLLQRQPLYQRSRRIAVYLAADGEGEVDLGRVIEKAWAQGKQIYLPVLQPRRTYRLWFVRYRPDSELRRNYYNLLEPRMEGTRPISASSLDLVLTPLVAFDNRGARLGMGGGYYDRTFAFKRTAPALKPYLVGVAHSCQEVDKLNMQNWDISLHAIATENKIIACGAGKQRDFR